MGRPRRSRRFKAKRRGTRSYRVLSASTIRKYLPLAAKLGVSSVARSQRGFLTAYRRAGYSMKRLPERWKRRRAAFIKRHMAQVNKRREALWRDGKPTRRHLALMMWAYSPGRKGSR